VGKYFLRKFFWHSLNYGWNLGKRMEEGKRSQDGIVWVILSKNLNKATLENDALFTTSTHHFGGIDDQYFIIRNAGESNFNAFLNEIVKWPVYQTPQGCCISLHYIHTPACCWTQTTHYTTVCHILMDCKLLPFFNTLSGSIQWYVVFGLIEKIVQ